MGLREWGLAAILLASSVNGCKRPTVQEQQTGYVPTNEFTMDKAAEVPKTSYDRGVHLCKLAEKETDKKKRGDLYGDAFNHFEAARKFEGREYDALLRQADCLSNLGDMLEALKLADWALSMDVPKKSKSAGYNLKGAIGMRHNIPEMAAVCYTESIEQEDNPVARWNRYDATMRFAVTPDGIRLDLVDRSLEDVKKYTEFNKEEPDGYLAQFVIYTMKSGALKAQEKDAEALKELKEGYLQLRNAFIFIDKGKQPKRNIGMTIEQFRQVYDQLKQVPEIQPKEY